MRVWYRYLCANFWFVVYLLVCEILFLVCVCFFLVHILNLVSILTRFKVFFLNNFFGYVECHWIALFIMFILLGWNVRVHVLISICSAI